MRALLSIPALVMLLGSGCYASHELGALDGVDAGARRDAPGSDAPRIDAASSPTCLPPGGHAALARIEDEVPAGCSGLPPESMIMVTIPPTEVHLAFSCGPDSTRVTETGPCAWSLEGECLIPDDSTRFSGTLSAEGEIRGELRLERSTFVGPCSFTIVIGG